MQDWMRKHRRLLMFFILIFIGIPFVFMFGMPDSGSNKPVNEDSAIANVGGVPLKESEFRRNLEQAAAAKAQQGGERPTYRQMDEDGTVQRVLEQMIDSALIRLQEQQRDFYVNETLLAKQMQQWDMFKDDKGVFNSQAWNEWVGNIARWDDIYDEMRGDVSRRVFLETVTAPANRVMERKIEEEVKGDATKFRIKYAKVDLNIQPTEEELLAHYTENPEAFRSPEQHVAEFMALSLAPPMPELATELVNRARAGEDFAALAAQYSNLSMPEGGDMGWRAEEEIVAPHLKPLFALAVGEVSEPTAGPTGFFIYKNEEERVSEETGAREVRGRQIVLHANLDEETRAARTALAEELAGQLQAGADPGALAAEKGLQVLRTSFFDASSAAIDNVSENDVFQFRSQAVTQKDEPWKPITARNSIFLTHIVESRQGEVPPLEQVRDRVVDAIAYERKQTDEYKAKVAEYAEQIKTRATKIEDILTLFPELDVKTGETEKPFTRKDMLFQQQVYVQTTEIYSALKDVDAGTMAGPLTGFFGDAWFVELIERVEPTEEEYAALSAEREQLRERLTQTAMYETVADYAKDLRERMLAQVPYRQDEAALERILGRGEADTETTPAAAEAEAADEAASEETTDAAAPTDDQAADATDAAETVETGEAADATDAAETVETGEAADATDAAETVETGEAADAAAQ